jgi:hypothetical protein
MAAPQMPARNTDSLLSALLDETETEVRDQTFKNMPVANRLWAQKEPGSGGDDIHRWPVSAGLNPNAKMIQSDADTVTWTATQTATTAWWDSMALFAVPVQGSLIREAKLKSKAAIINLVELELKQATHTLKRMISSQTFGDGTIPGTLIGLSGILPSSGVGSNTVYNIPEVSNRFWRNLYFNSVGSWPVHGLFGSTDDIITQAYLSGSDNGADTPNLAITDITVAMAYARAEGRTRQTTSRAELAQIGRAAVPETQAGAWLPIYNADLVWDVQCPTGYMYMVHTEDFMLIEDPSFNMRWLGPLQIGNQPFLTGRVLTYRCQSEVYRRNWNVVLTGITG